MSGWGSIVLIAGPNGAGKTTFARSLLSDSTLSFEYFNADMIAAELLKRGAPAGNIELQAGRQLLDDVGAAIELGLNVMIETTLSGSNWARRIPEWQRAGYAVSLYYLRLPNPEAAIARVAQRVAAGGHAIPEAVIRRRFARSLTVLEQFYKPIVDAWWVYDSLAGEPPRLVEMGVR